MTPHDTEPSPSPLTGRNALITGGSRGLGRALGRALADRGARVVLVAREPSTLREASAYVAAAGGEAHVIAADIATPGAALAIAAQAAAMVGPIDLLINNASTLGPTPMPRLLDLEPSSFARVLQTNLLAPYELTRAVAGSMLLRGRGLIINISSDAGAEAYPGWGAYGVSKAALDHLTRSWAVELEDAGVRVFSVDPGEMHTAMHAAALPEADPASLADPADIAARIVAMIEAPARASSGSRQLASAWELGSAQARAGAA